MNLPIEGDGDLDVTPCIDIQDVLIGGERYRPLAQVGLDVHSLPKYPLLLLEDLSNSRRCLDKYARENGVELNPILELGSSDLLVSFAKINLGLTFVIREFTEEALSSGGLYEIPLVPPVPQTQDWYGAAEGSCYAPCTPWGLWNLLDCLKMTLTNENQNVNI